MNYFLVLENKVVSVRSTTPTLEERLKQNWISRNDIGSFMQAERIVEDLADLMLCDTYVAVDCGEGTYPRFDVVAAPKVGEAVSYGFNGDYYPDGVIVAVTKKFKVTTSTGNTYRRRKLTANWKQPHGPWSLVHGHISEQNPHF